MVAWCQICEEIVKDPLITICQHSFCYQCLLDCFVNFSEIACPCCANLIQWQDCNKDFCTTSIETNTIPSVKQAPSSKNITNKKPKKNFNKHSHEKSKKRAPFQQKQLDISEKFFPLLKRNMASIKQQGCRFIQFPETASAMLIIHCETSQQILSTEACIMDLIHNAFFKKSISIAKYKHREIALHYKQQIENETGAKIWLPRKDEQSNNQIKLKGDRTAVQNAELKLYSISTELSATIRIQVMVDGVSYFVFCKDVTPFDQFYTAILSRCSIDEQYTNCSVYIEGTEISKYNIRTLEQLDIKNGSIITAVTTDVEISFELEIEKYQEKKTITVPLWWNIKKLIDYIDSCVAKDETIEELELNYIDEEASKQSLHKLALDQSTLYHHGFCSGMLLTVSHVPNHFYIILYAKDVSDTRVMVMNTFTMLNVLETIVTKLVKYNSLYQQCVLMDDANNKIVLNRTNLAKNYFVAEQRYKIEVEELHVNIIFELSLDGKYPTKQITATFPLSSKVEQVINQALSNIPTHSNYTITINYKNSDLMRDTSKLLYKVGMTSEIVCNLKIVALKKPTQIELKDRDQIKPTTIIEYNLDHSFQKLVALIMSKINYDTQFEKVIFFSKNGQEVDLKYCSSQSLEWIECTQNSLQYQIKEATLTLKVLFPDKNDQLFSIAKKTSFDQFYATLISLVPLQHHSLLIEVKYKNKVMIPTTTPVFKLFDSNDSLEIQLRSKYICISLPKQHCLIVDITQTVSKTVIQIQKLFHSKTIECKWNQRILSETNVQETIQQLGIQDGNEVSVIEKASCTIQ